MRLTLVHQLCISVRRPVHVVRVAVVLAAVVSMFAADEVIAAPIPRAAAKLIQEGNALLKDKKFAEALEKFDEAEKLAPDAPEIAYNRGVALYRMEAFEKAQSAFQDALRPERPDIEARAKYNLARAAHASALAKKDDPENAIKELKRAIGFYKDTLSLKSEDADAARNLSMAERMQAFLEKRLEAMKQQQEQQPSDEGNPSSQPSDQEQQQQQQKSDSSENAPSSQPQEGESSQQNDSQKDSTDQQQSSEQEASPSTQPDVSDPSDSENANQSDDPAHEEPQPRDSENGNSQSEQEQEADSGEQKEDAEKQKQAAASQPSATSMPSSQPSQPDTEKISREQALRLLEEAREAERQRREMLKARERATRGRIRVDKDW